MERDHSQLAISHLVRVLAVSTTDGLERPLLMYAQVPLHRELRDQGPASTRLPMLRRMRCTSLGHSEEAVNLRLRGFRRDSLRRRMAIPMLSGLRSRRLRHLGAPVAERRI